MRTRPFLYVFMPLWLLLGFWQAGFSRLIPDEAYYWLYAQNLAWGYFDHPPAVAVMIKAGTLLFANEWGVRCVGVLLSAGTLWLIYKITQPVNEWLFIAIVTSIVPLHLLCNFAVPDVPLLFFAALFFYAIKRYLSAGGKTGMLLVLIAVVGTFYSKYHAVLIVLFTLLAVPVVWRYPSFYVILIVSIAAYVPHILWQFAHNFCTIRYQLYQRTPPPSALQSVLDYLGGQWAMLGALASPLLLFGSFSYKTRSAFDKVLIFNLAGFLIFFFLMSFRGWVEANWTVPCWIPLIVLSYKYLEGRAAFFKWMKPIAWVSFLAIIGAKVSLTFPFADKMWFDADHFHAWEKWAADVKEKAQGNPVVFMNSYQDAAEYKFYAHQPATSLNLPYIRSNQFDYWHYSEEMQGKKVMLVPSGWWIQPDGSFATRRDTVKYKWINKYYDFHEIRFSAFNVPAVCRANKEFTIQVLGKDCFKDKTALAPLSFLDAEVCYVFTGSGIFMLPQSSRVRFTTAKLNDTLKINITAPAKPGKYLLYLCLEDPEHKISFAPNSEPVSIVIKE